MEFSSATREQLAEAISVLYFDPDQSRKAEANVWLTRFSGSTHAWTLAASSLESGTVEFRYFCANLLLAKVRASWSQLAVTERLTLINHLCQVIARQMADASAPTILVNRICLVLAAISVSNTHVPAATDVVNTFDVRHCIHTALEAAAQVGVGAAGGGLGPEGGEPSAVAVEHWVGRQTIAVVLALLEAVIEEADRGMGTIAMRLLEVSEASS